MIKYLADEPVWKDLPQNGWQALGCIALVAGLCFCVWCFSKYN